MSSYLAFKSLIASYSKKSEFIALHLALSQGREEEEQQEGQIHSAAAYLVLSPTPPPSPLALFVGLLCC